MSVVSVVSVVYVVSVVFMFIHVAVQVSIAYVVYSCCSPGLYSVCSVSSVFML